MNTFPDMPQHLFITGPVGQLELQTTPDQGGHCVAIICHPKVLKIWGKVSRLEQIFKFIHSPNINTFLN